MKLKNKLWFNIFVRVAVIFVIFTVVLSLSNITLLLKFFVFKEKSALLDQMSIINECSLSDTDALLNTMSEIREKYNFDVEIYTGRGTILHTTHGGKMMDFYNLNDQRFDMSREEMVPITQKTYADGTVISESVRNFDQTEFLVCTKEIESGTFAEIRIQKSLVADSAKIANQFILIISGICLVLSIAWIFAFARKFSRPITQMNDITKGMASLDFTQKIATTGSDEIGELSRSINYLSACLSEALEDLKQKNARLKADIDAQLRLDQMRRAFIANVSHELKTPISIINGYAEGLKMDINPRSRLEYCDTIISEGNRMNQLVLSILELSKYESGQIPISLSRVDIAETAAQLTDRIFKGSSVTAQCQIPENTFVLADSLQINQVLNAFLENALAYTPENGKVTLTATGDSVVRISVFNTGSHIENEVMPHIWQSFYRGDTSHKRDSSHFGLGLSIVSAILKMHNSRCGVYNTNEGVCFWFELERFKD